MDATDLLLRFLVAIGVGFLIGLQREQSAKGVLAAGSRTFPLVALLGALCQAFFPDTLPWAFGGVVVLASLGYVARVKESGDPGLATSVASVLTFLYGALALVSAEGRLLAVVLGVATTAILALKEPLHALAHRIAAEEVRATLLFLVVALVVFPLLPDSPVPWLLGLNPRFVWLAVVLVSAIDLAAYLFVKFFATRRGHLLAGVVGGLVSSTATTVSMARQTRQQPSLHRLFRIGIVAASAVMMLRIVIEVAAVHPPLLLDLAIPAALVFAWLALVLAVWLRRPMQPEPEGPPARNPFRLSPALLFGLFFAATLLATAWLSARFGAAGAYSAAIVSGMIDVDATTLSLSRLAAQGALDPRVAASAIVLVAASSLLFKLAIILAIGTRRLAASVALAFASAPLVALGAILFWRMG